MVGAVETGSPAERAGIQRGDRMLTVAGDEVPTWDDLDMAVGTRANRDIADHLRSRRPHAVGRRSGRPPQGKYEIGDIGVLPDVSPIVAVGGARRSGRSRRA